MPITTKPSGGSAIRGKPSGPRSLTLAVAGIALAVLLVGAGAFLWVGDNGGGGSAIGGPFTLTDSNGKQVSESDFRGKYLLIYFGYTYCPDVCPTTLNEVAAAMDKLGPKAARLQPLFITVDPARDTPSVLKTYTAAFSPKLIGLTGTDAQISKVAREYRVYYAVNRSGKDSKDSKDYSVDHSSILYLMGPDGKFIAPIRTDETGAEMAATLNKYLS
jgi:protein SCO1/2